MRWISKIPSEDMARKEELMKDGWRPIKEPKTMGAVIAAAIPISFLLLLIVGGWLTWLFPAFREAMNFEKITFRIDLKLLLYLIGIYLYILIHELIHLAMIPDAFRSPRTFFGLNGFFGFVYSEEIMTKGRFLLVSIMPLFILSFVASLILFALGGYHGYWMLLFLINAAGACVDIFNILLVGWQVPRKGMIVGNGMATYYKA